MSTTNVTARVNMRDIKRQFTAKNDVDISAWTSAARASNKDNWRARHNAKPKRVIVNGTLL